VEKILNQNIRMDSKLETLITGQKNLEERILNLEKLINDNNNNDSNNNSIDPDYVKVCVIYQI
jgi:hypothetical protein